MPTLHTCLHHVANSDGRRTVIIRVTHLRKHRVIRLGRYCRPDQFHAGRFRKNYPDYSRHNDILRTYEQRAYDYLHDIERNGMPYSFEALKAAVLKSRSTVPTSAWRYVDSIAEQMKQMKPGTASLYHATANVLKQFAPGLELTNLDSSFLERFETYLRTKRALSDAAISLHLRNVRAACNRAVKAKVMPPGFAPFASYSLSHLSKTKARKAIGRTEIMAIINAECFTDWESLSRDLFAFSFYCRGMNLADIATLRPCGIVAGRVEYVRQKTGKAYSVPINEQARAILSKYSGWYYCFPVHTIKEPTPMQAFNRIHKLRPRINGALRSIAARVGVNPDGVTFYVARHTYANLHKQAGTPIDVIRELLGHSDVRTTEHYVKSFDSGVLDGVDAGVFG